MRGPGPGPRFRPVEIDAGDLRDAAAIVFIAMPQVADHAQLDRFRALL
jgi:hypothetical protein